MRITWDEAKNHTNQRKHGISFEEAQDLFLSGADYLELFDETHSEDEDRFIAIGFIVRGVAVVIWTQRDDDAVRIISARMATKNETRLFHKHMTGNS